MKSHCLRFAPASGHRIVSAPSAKSWDAFDAYLFDIDGTLLRALGGVHNDAFPKSVRQVMEREISLERVVLHGNTDTRILAQALEHSGIARAAWEPCRKQILDRMCELVSARRAQIEILMIAWHPRGPQSSSTEKEDTRRRHRKSGADWLAEVGTCRTTPVFCLWRFQRQV